MSILSSARFFTTVAQMRQLPRGDIAEVAFVGRSNAGKSSALNVLCQRKRLAFASRTPGRTQALNFFAVGPEPVVSAYLVDTPGYGYAVAPHEVKKEWGLLGGRYLQSRSQLSGVVLIVDIRRRLTALDQALLDWIAPGQRLLVIASKSDKLSRSEQVQAGRAIHDAVLAHRKEAPDRVILFSATARTGVEEARSVIESWLCAAPKKTPALEDAGV